MSLLVQMQGLLGAFVFVAEASAAFRTRSSPNDAVAQASMSMNFRDMLRLHAHKNAINSTDSKNSGSKADSCACEFKGECTCQNSLEFMNCISGACATGDCDCHEHQYHNACVDMANTCVSLDFKCASDKVLCTMETVTSSKTMEAKPHEQSTPELQDELKELVKKKCKLEEAEKDGWLNADNRLRELEPEIEDHVKALEARKADVPAMSCDVAEEPAEKPKEKKTAPVPKSLAAVPVQVSFFTLLAALSVQ